MIPAPVIPSRIAVMLALLLVWATAIRLLLPDWRNDPQYGYGMIVPLLVLGLLAKRRDDRPDPVPVSNACRTVAAAAAIGGALVMALTIPVSEANAGWRPLGLLAAVSSVMITLSFILGSGGVPWLRHYAFPVCFFLISVPWPRNLEQAVMSRLTEWNTMLSVEALHWFGYQAMSRGNLILLPCGTLGVEEACSGIRSLQSGLMVALFCGEVLRLSAVRRIGLLAVALAAALLGNAIRNTMLALIASANGLAAVAAWHDAAGLLVLLVTVVLIVITAMHWRSPSPGLRPASDAAPTPQAWALPSLLVATIVFLLIAGSFAGTEAWFRTRGLPSGEGWAWIMSPRAGVAGVMPVPLPDATLRMLHHPRGFSEKWTAPSGEAGQAFFFEWPPGRTALQAIAVHNPEVCLGSMGMRKAEVLPPVIFTSEGATVPFRAWLFEDRGRPVYVFHTMMEPGRASMVPEDPDLNEWSWFRNLREGRRNRGQRMVEVAFWNLPDRESARASLEAYLRQSIHPLSQGGTSP